MSAEHLHEGYRLAARLRRDLASTLRDDPDLAKYADELEDAAEHQDEMADAISPRVAPSDAINIDVATYSAHMALQMQKGVDLGRKRALEEMVVIFQEALVHAPDDETRDFIRSLISMFEAL